MAKATTAGKVLTVRRTDVSRQTEYISDFGIVAGTKNTILPPPYNLDTLARIKEESNMLPQCVECYKTNVGKYGFSVVPYAEGVEMDLAEKAELEDFLARVNADESFASVHSKLIDNYETFGHGYHEVVRDRKGRVSLIRHARASSIRCTPLGDELIPVKYDIARGPRVTTVVEQKRFRKYIQMNVSTAPNYTYFKEFGDPRDMDYVTGEYGTKDTPIPEERLATEILHIRQQSSDPYGVPRWVSQVPSVMGSRKSEIVNMDYFDDNTVPPFAILVGGGKLTKQSYEDLRRLLEEQGVGKNRQHKGIILEAVPEREGLDDKGTVSMSIEKLADARQSDALFSGYDKANQTKILSAFRLPGILVGLSTDQQFASGQTAQFIAEQQVFAPERRMYDEIYNIKLINSPFGLNLKTVKIKSNNPVISIPTDLVKAGTALNVMGGLTPRTAIALINSAIQVDVPQYPERGDAEWEEWMDTPIMVTTANVQKQTDAAVKDAKTKQIEGDGDITVPPEHGQE